MRNPAVRLSLARCLTLAATALAIGALIHPAVRAGVGFRNNAVGGISIDANGVLQHPTVEAMQELRQAIAEQIGPVPAEMDTGLGLRKISLRQLEAALQQAVHQDLGQLPDEIRLLAGLQRVQYVLVYPEQQDIVLVGPGEGWRVNDRGQVVGKSTGHPVLQLEDVLVSFQAAFEAEGTISCSIDATEEGIQAFRRYTRDQKRFSPNVLTGMAENLGAQQITISGVPETSHFARVLVAADYRMKRIAMRLEPTPLASLPSFLDMLAGSRAKLTNMMPRWWLACDYEPLARSEDGLAWELRGQGVQCKTEDDLVANDGTVTPTGRQSPIAARWASEMTRQYDELSERDPVFGQLRNLMDLSVIAALIKREQLMERAGCSLPTLTGQNHDFVLQAWNPPKTVATVCSFIKRGREYLITASGGVQIDAWRYAAQSQVSPHVGQIHASTPHAENRWWW